MTETPNEPADTAGPTPDPEATGAADAVARGGVGEDTEPAKSDAAATGGQDGSNSSGSGEKQAAERSAETAKGGDHAERRHRRASQAEQPGPRDPYDYPRNWEADVVLSDGGTVHIRPIVPSDADAIVALHGRLSEETRYLRYFGAYPRIPPKDLERFTVVDHYNRVALVAVLGDDVVGVGRYERIGEGSPNAEVAFVVDDAHQGRGLGSILLEHLAAAAAECGVERFEAEVLSENRVMMRVFTDAGYHVTKEYEYGTLHLEFDIDPTEESLAVARAREQAAEARSVHNLLHPRSVAVIGASADPGKIGYVVLSNLVSADFAGTVYPVNDNRESVRGVKAYPSVVDIPDEVDLAVVAVPAEKVFDVLDGALEKGVKALVIVSAGFSEAGPHGLHAELQLVGEARAHGMRLVGPSALGVLNTDPKVRLNATLAPWMPGRGRTGFFCQSGALGVAILADTAKRGLGLSTFVSAGNRADVSVNDLLQYWETDPATDTVLLYLESFGNPRKFARLARRLARKKPIAVVRAGRHAVSRELAAASAQVDEAAVQALFEHAGVIRVDTLAQLFDVALVLAHQPLPQGPSVAIVGNSTAVGALAADTAMALGLTVAYDPVDVGPQAGPEEFGAAVRDAVRDPDVDSLVVVWAPPVSQDAAPYAEAVRKVVGDADQQTKPVVSTFLAVEGVPESLAVRSEDGTPTRGSIPSYPTPERAVTALARVTRYAAWRQRPSGSLVRPEGVHPERAQQVVREIQAESGRTGWLSDEQCIALLDCYGIEILPHERVGSADEAVAAAERLGYPVAVKSVDERLSRRPDLSGARLDLIDERQVRAAYADLQRISGTPGALVQQMAPRGSSCAIGLQDDPSFGSLVSFGLSGVLGDLIGDRAYRIVPLTDIDAADLVREPRSAALLTGYRGDEPADLGALADLALRVSALAEDLPEIRELSLDPVIANPDGVVVVAAKVRIGDPPARPDTGPRRLPSITEHVRFTTSGRNT
ncbi:MULTISPECIES: bifunctional GNAT family N-acetyltransferase/acetate--CoA ligase family protein [Thermocrispum]|jgi:acyl-CoA synthetase (NDP forming)/GNAT superfamily N-acetyltransferase|uniref:GNAT family N-acetyltransferase n=2 Tax=Thermocrispum agreste TaxID=37925 RepID=A0ABD6FEV2_9PSEU|nr:MULTISPECIES: bifunctional GNAT family N-acetyltransferase/acetate--CoA ligase family protein [Thermocrispum]